MSLPEWSKGPDLRPGVFKTRGFDPHRAQNMFFWIQYFNVERIHPATLLLTKIFSYRKKSVSIQQFKTFRMNLLIIIDYCIIDNSETVQSHILLRIHPATLLLTKIFSYRKKSVSIQQFKTFRMNLIIIDYCIIDNR